MEELNIPYNCRLLRVCAAAGDIGVITIAYRLCRSFRRWCIVLARVLSLAQLIEVNFHIFGVLSDFPDALYVATMSAVVDNFEKRG